jgi:hypothetical protein
MGLMGRTVRIRGKERDLAAMEKEVELLVLNQSVAVVVLRAAAAGYPVPVKAAPVAPAGGRAEAVDTKLLSFPLLDDESMRMNTTSQVSLRTKTMSKMKSTQPITPIPGPGPRATATAHDLANARGWEGTPG